MIHINAMSELVHIDMFGTQTNIDGLLYEDLWLFYVK